MSNTKIANGNGRLRRSVFVYLSTKGIFSNTTKLTALCLNISLFITHIMHHLILIQCKITR